MLQWRAVRVQATRGVCFVTALMAAVVSGRPAQADMKWKAGDFELRPAGYIQMDGRAFPGWEVEPGLGLRTDSFDIRRLRAGFKFDVRALSGEFVVDGADLANRAISDDDPHPAFTLQQHLKDAYLELALGKDHFLRAGHFKVPVTREFLTSASKIDFAERSMLASGMAPGRDWGVMFGGKLGELHGLEYLIGGFAGDGWSENFRSEATGAARLVLEVSSKLEIGASGSLGAVEADTEDPLLTPEPHSLRGRSASEWSFFRRVHVDGQRRRLGADMQLVAGPLTLRGEVLQAREERKGQGSTFLDLPPLVGLGWSGTAVWRLLGPRTKKDEAHGKTPVDLAVRYESLRFDDDGPDEGFAGTTDRARNIRAQSAQSVLGSLSCWPRPWIRLLGNVIVDRYNDALFAPEMGRKGNYVTLIGRLQLEVP
jgi:hypothetical protein